MTEKIAKVHQENKSVHESLTVWAEPSRQTGRGPLHL